MRTIPPGMPNWEPLERAVPVSWLPDFMHMGEHGTIQLYKHRDTRCYLNIDSDSMRFYRYRDGGYVEVSQTTAILDPLGIRNWDIPVIFDCTRTRPVESGQCAHSFLGLPEKRRQQTHGSPPR